MLLKPLTKPKLLVTCEGMNPQCLPLWEATWDFIKNKHPKLKVTVFTIPFYKGEAENDVFRNKEFKRWHKERKGWVDIVQLGYTHFNPECIRLSKPQYILLKRGYRKIGRYMSKKIYCFKPSFDRIGPYTDGVLTNLGFSAYLYHKSIVFLRTTNSDIEDFILVKTRISFNEKHPDDISKLFKNISTYLTKMEKQKYSYTTFTNIVKNSIGGEVTSPKSS